MTPPSAGAFDDDVLHVNSHKLGAFAIILDAASRVLLCHRTDQDMWNLPGGGVEAGESPWDAVIREVTEEVGLLVRVDRLLGVYAKPARAELTFNFLCVPFGGAIRRSDEADNVEWFSQAAIPTNTLPRQRARIDDAFADQGGVVLRIQA